MITKNSLEDISIQLEDIWRELWQVFGFYESWKSEPAKCKDIQQRLLYFNQSHSENLEYICDVIQALSKGFYLIKSGLEWEEPAVGHNTNNKPNDTHRARGIQWQLVMVWGGFETITKTLIKTHKKHLEPEIIQEFINKCNLSEYGSLTPPDSNLLDLERWLNKPACKNQSAIANFLGIENGDQKIIEHWMVQSHPISSWVEAVRLAKALRNATSHGALSATKVKEWGLQKPIINLSNNLGEIVISSMQKLIPTT
ncbi:hypothetical protein NIES21_22800 [Anabaenopsis circularis NIES-21]|uniref:RiboL-PSP-HEPN domain-containing protein n=1 Tax=Anabaenopsis circularis NIES-21 TaxID=1085406 RepID=A0A1Z4GG26_9CYAN|nr:hypothetical protein NIES21_22800 [Anabaenopsis circularis NIES-21]